MGRRQSCQLKPDSPPWSCPPPQEQPQPHEAEDFPWSCPWSWACSEVQPPAGVQAHEKSGELLAESGALLKESAPVLIKNGARSAARAAARAETQRPAAEKDEGRRGVDMMKSIEGGGANGESFGRTPQRGEGKCRARMKCPTKARRGAHFRPISSAACAVLGRAVRVFAVGEGTLRGDVGRGLRRFPRAILEVVTPGRFAGRSRCTDRRESAVAVGVHCKCRPFFSQSGCKVSRPPSPRGAAWGRECVFLSP